MFKRFEKVFLKLEARQFFYLQEPHRKLTKRIQGEKNDRCVGMAANLVEVFSKYFPDSGPLDPNSSHVVVTNFDKFLQAVSSRGFALS